LEKRNGTPYEARDYCKGDKKNNGSYIEGSFKEYGDIMKCPMTKLKKGERTDIKLSADIIKNGGNLADLDPVMIVKYSKGFKELINLRDQKKEDEKVTFKPLTVYVITGGGGSGKTRKVYEREGKNNVYKLRKTQNEVYFDNYRGEKVLLLDDFYGWLKWDFLLELLDGYSQLLNVKNGSTYKNWDTVYITSNTPYQNWYPSKGMSDDDLYPLTRRITYISEMHLNNEERHRPIPIDL